MTNCTDLDPDVEITEIPIPPALKRAGTIVKNFYTQALDFATPMSRRDYWPTAGFYAATSRRLVDAGYHWALSLLSVVPGVNLFILAACARPTAARAVTTTTTEETSELA